MDVLTKGFCASLMNDFTSSVDGGTCPSLCLTPTLQVVDIQRYPKIPTENEVSRFYLVVSDSLALAWLIIPPETDMEELVHTFQLEIGCCITLGDYAVVSAKNQHNVLVPRFLTFSDVPAPLIGNPVHDPVLFNLSQGALTRREEVCRPSGSNLSVGEHAVLTLREVLAAFGEGLGDYEVHLRIIFKGKQRPFTSRTHPTGRFVFDSVGVDRNGDAMSLVFFGGTMLYDLFDVGDCVRARRPALSHRGGGVAQLRLSDRAAVVSCEEADRAIPRLPRAVHGARALCDVLDRAAVGDAVTVAGVVDGVRPVAVEHTRHGRVERLSLTLRDGAAVVEGTLWGELARAVRPVPGERWCLAGFALRTFMHRVTLSSCAGSAAFEMAATEGGEDTQLRMEHFEFLRE